MCCPDLGFPYTYIYIEFVLFDQPSPRQMCEEFVRGGSAQMNPSAHAPHVVTVLSIFDATPPTSCLVSSSLCKEYSPKKPAYLDLFLQQVANFCLPSMLRDRPTGQRSGSLFPNKEVKLRANHNDIFVSGLALAGTRILSFQFSTCPLFVHFSPCH